MRYPDPFLAAHGYGAAERQPLAADASFRRYVRLRGGPRPALLMDAPPPEDVRPFAALARHFGAAGLSLPEIIAEDPEAGFLLIEDFGDATHAALLDAGADPVPLYVEAAEALAALHAAPVPPGLPAWDAAAMARATAATFLDWWWPAALGAPAGEAVRAELDAAIGAMLAPFAGLRGFVHRDYFPANLMRLETREGPRRTGILDFQDGALGHPAYDLASLVEDARRDVAPAARRAALAAYLAARPGLDRTAFLGALAACGAQRHLRVAALWVRLDRRDGKPHYLRHGPRCWALLARALSQPACAPLRDVLDRHVPEAMRRNPER
ncbi:aminoglycoside phosphotransferase family protein [Roseicella frigidaeris]|uniref:Aminoglycoside phosphotransferase n=1 Tax=Roseicella frigidaeris TaxID=2230885 RepID=A0A327MEY4_9PROT|nr:phosphotransferase [Roseicella frigidaeris]RAI60623.1 aminoglycoside phosphotransferase [Roseicella frigidaeris]